jgi:platelet-activating factor acetylhydrolase IB subunit alpha
VDLTNGDVKAEFRGHDNVVEAATFCPPHSVAAIRELMSLKGVGIPAPSGASIVFAVTASRDKTVKIWDAIRGQCLYTLVRTVFRLLSFAYE